MPKILTDVDNYDTTVTVPEPGDLRAAASVETGFQNLTNRTHYLNGKVGVLQQPVLWQGTFNGTYTSASVGLVLAQVLDTGGYTLRVTDTALTPNRSSIEVPAAGWYRVTTNFAGFASNPAADTVWLVQWKLQDGAEFSRLRKGGVLNPGIYITQSHSVVTQITTPSSERINFPFTLLTQDWEWEFSTMTIERLDRE